MQRRAFLLAASAASCSALSGCALLRLSRIDPMSVYLRSDIITSPEIEHDILSKAKVGWSPDGRIRVLYLKGTPYERGYQHGVLLRNEVTENWATMYEAVLRKFRIKELFFESFDRARPYIPQRYFEEMRGLAHGSKLSLEVIHHMHILPEIGEWGGKKHIKQVIKQMMDGGLGSTCSNFCAGDSATKDSAFYTVRILDWGLHRISQLHKFPLIAVHKPDEGAAFVNIGWIGFIGAISGMNEHGITLGEMGYGDKPDETLRGQPMPFVLRDVLQDSKNLADVRRIISSAPPTNRYIYLMSDGKTKEAELYIRDRHRFDIFKPGQRLLDEKNDLPGISDVVYGGHYKDKMTALLTENHGELTPELIMQKIIPAMAMPSNFQNVIYDPVKLNFWVNNARSPKERAAEQPYTFFDFAQSLREF
jgi:hypothetical protein